MATNAALKSARALLPRGVDIYDSADIIVICFATSRGFSFFYSPALMMVRLFGVNLMRHTRQAHKMRLCASLRHY